jgi:hypothetical protein
MLCWSEVSGVERIKVQPRPKWSVVLFLVAGFSVLFTVPYLFPAKPALSEAYLLGYNTFAGIAILLFFSLAFGIFTRGFGLFLPSPVSIRRTTSFPLRLPIFISLLVAVACSLLWICTRERGGIQEAFYFFIPQYENYRLGGALYRDFDFVYGPLMFYPVVLLVHLTGMLYVDAYFFIWMLESIAGVYLIWKAVDWTAGGAPHARSIFLLVSGFFCLTIQGEGLQYTPVRFLSSIVLALWVERAYRSGKNLFLVFFVAGAGAALLLLFSPDQGIQFMIGTILYFALCQRTPRKRLYPALALFCLLSVAAVALGWRLGEFKFLMRIGGGALNFPLLFSLTTVIVLLYVVFAGTIAIAAYRNKQLDHPLVYLLALALITVPAAMGRCDPGHIFINTLGATLAVMVVFAQQKGFFRLGTLPLTCLLAFLYLSSVWPDDSLGVPFQEMAAQPERYPRVAHFYEWVEVRMHGREVAIEKIHRMHLPVEPLKGKPLPDKTALLAVFGSTVRLHPPERGIRIFPGRYPGSLLTSNNFSEEKIEDMQRDPSRPLLLARGWQGGCVIHPEDLRATMKVIFKAPYAPSVKHSFQPFEPICQYIRQNYQLSDYASPLAGMDVYEPLRRN